MTRIIESCRVVSGKSGQIAVIGMAGVAQTVAMRLDPSAGHSDRAVVAVIAERLGVDEIQFEEPRWQAVLKQIQADRRAA